VKAFYTVKELADASGFSAGTIQNRIRDGEIFAVQSVRRGAFRIPASAYLSYLAKIGKGPRPTTAFLPDREFTETGPRELYDREIAPVLRAGGFRDMPALLRAVEAEPDLFDRYRDAIHVYTAYLERSALAV